MTACRDLTEPRAGGGGEFLLAQVPIFAAVLCRVHQLLLLVDDAHWADVASLRWLAYLLNRLEGLLILAAIATRPSQSGVAGELLTTILAHRRARIFAVGPLGDESVATLVRTRLGVDPDPSSPWRACGLRPATRWG